MDGKIKPIQLELRRQTGAGRVRAWGRPAAEETLQQMPADLFHMSDYTLVVQPHANLGTEPPGELWKYQDKFKDRPWHDARDIERDANEIIRAFPKLLPIPAAEWLTKLDAVITLETNRTDWTRLVELVALIGGNPKNSTPEENATVRLVVGFDCLLARVNAELHPALQEAEEIVRRVWDRAGEAVRAGQLEIKGRSVSDPTVVVTIPASLVTAELIWSLLRSSELAIAYQQYVDIRIGPPEPPKATPEPQHTVGPSCQRAVQLAGEPATPAESPPEPATLTDLIFFELAAMSRAHFESRCLLQDLIKHLFVAVQLDKDAAALPRVELLKLIFKVITRAAQVGQYELAGHPDDPSNSVRTIPPATLPSFLLDEWDRSRLIVDGPRTIWHGVTVRRIATPVTESNLDESTPEANPTDVEQPDQPQTIVPFRSGGPGRPTAIDVVVAEGKRRIEAGEVTPTPKGLTKFATTLHEWWEAKRQTYAPIAPSAGVTTICNGLREFWNSKLPPQTPPDR
jgi:hypothetical protein